MEKKFNFGSTYLTPSGTHSLELAINSLDLEIGDEVIIPSFTFSSVANCIVLAGATPVFCDINIETMNIDIVSLQNLITNKTKAIIVVNYAGVSPDYDKIRIITNQHGLILIEDNAHGLGSKYKNKYLGTFGDMSTLSFHETKNIQTGEGGALIVNNKKFDDTISIRREKGTNRKKFHLGLIDKYTWIEKGSSWLMSEISASLLWAQLQDYDLIQSRRNSIWNGYQERLKKWAYSNEISLPVIPENTTHNSHIFYLRFKNKVIRDSFIEYMRENEIMAVFHYQALHRSEAGIRFGKTYADCINSILAEETLVRLPLFPDLSAGEQNKIIETILGFKNKHEL
jgi:dTDP-4-amino-4,6-dideoxygalactose transaminase